MLGVLLASVGAAWMIISSHRAHWRHAATRGAELIAKIRQKGLAEYWGSKPLEDWYLLRDPQDQPVGWRYASRESADGGYAGKFVRRLQGSKYSDVWQLDPGATTGTYSSRSINEPPSEIHLAAGRLTVRIGDTSVTDRNPPPDYVPEGMLELVAFLASTGEEDIAGKMVVNNDAFDGDKIRYHSFIVIPLGERKVQVRFAGPGRGSVYSFDAAGRIESIHRLDMGVIVTRVSGREVMFLYREARNIAGRTPPPAQPSEAHAGDVSESI